MKSSKLKLSARKRSPWPVLAAAIVLLLAGGGTAWYFLVGSGAAQAKAGSATEETTYTYTIKRGDISISASGSGKLVAYQSVDLSFSTSGTVSELNVKLGDTVKAGQTLASLSDSQALDASVANAELKVLNAQKTLTDLQQNASVALAQAYSDLVAAQDSYDTALTKSQKVESQRCSQSVNTRYKAALDRATEVMNNLAPESKNSDVYIKAKASYDTAKANYDYCISYTSDEKTSAQSALDVAKTALQAAQDTYDTLKAASGIDPNAVAMAEANLKEARAQLSNAKEKQAGIVLTSPIDGKVTYLADAAGAMVDTSKFITISDVSHSTLDISVDESDTSKLVVGSAVTVSFDALPDVSFSGKVTQVNPQITVSGQYRVAKGQAELNADAVKTVSALPLGLSATITIVNQEAKNALLAPIAALKDLGDGTYGLMVKASDGQMKLQIVIVGLKDSDYAEITSGIKEGDVVSTGTVNFIAAGSSSNSSNLKNAQNDSGFPGGPGGGPMP